MSVRIKYARIPGCRSSDILRFWNKVEQGASDECWLWTASHKGSHCSIGYGQFNLGGRTYSAHRVAYFLAFEAQPGEHDVCHTCDNKLCCNPHHFFLGSRKENLEDMVRKGRSRKGQKHHNAKLTTAQIKEIRDSALGQRVLAGQFGVTQQHISNIRRGRRWSHVA